MKPTSVRLDPDTLDELDAEAEEREISRNRWIQIVIENRNKYVDLKQKHEQLQDDYDDLEAKKDEIETHRDALEEGHSVETDQIEEIVSDRDRYREKVDDLEDENDRLQRQLAAANARQDDLGEIVEYVEDEKSLAKRREKRREANVFRRAWWWVTGTPPSDADA